MTAVAHEIPDVRPPTTSHAKWVSGAAAVCPTVAIRPSVTCRILPGSRLGVSPDHPYVRRFWVAAIGVGPVVDLLRMIAAARAQRSIPLPIHLPILLSEGLVRMACDAIAVPSRVPRLGTVALRRLPHLLQAEHRQWLADPGTSG